MACRPERRAVRASWEGRDPRVRCAGLGLRGGLGPDRNHGAPTMAQAKTFVALDVHVSGTVAAVNDGASGELRRRRLSGRAVEEAEFAAGLPGPVRVTHAAGATGFALARRPKAAGVSCRVCAGAGPAWAVGSCQDRPAPRRAPGAAADRGRVARGRSGASLTMGARSRTNHARRSARTEPGSVGMSRPAPPSGGGSSSRSWARPQAPAGFHGARRLGASRGAAPGRAGARLPPRYVERHRDDSGRCAGSRSSTTPTRRRATWR
jgi:hypothetical protein